MKTYNTPHIIAIELMTEDVMTSSYTGFTLTGSGDGNADGFIFPGSQSAQ